MLILLNNEVLTKTENAFGRHLDTYSDRNIGQLFKNAKIKLSKNVRIEFIESYNAISGGAEFNIFDDGYEYTVVEDDNNFYL